MDFLPTWALRDPPHEICDCSMYILLIMCLHEKVGLIMNFIIINKITKETQHIKIQYCSMYILLVMCLHEKVGLIMNIIISNKIK